MSEGKQRLPLHPFESGDGESIFDCDDNVKKGFAGLGVEPSSAAYETTDLPVVLPAEDKVFPHRF